MIYAARVLLCFMSLKSSDMIVKMFMQNQDIEIIVLMENCAQLS